ncbi:MAG: hypothetical protein HN392_08125 [Anaerolineae bacterium]|jgi:hypothetical protein|nr:hypothetical protein [Anaerolineae bacterium]
MNSVIRFWKEALSSKKNIFGIIIISSIWLFLWYWPWQVYLQSYIWIKLGLGLLFFIIPGGALYGILSKSSTVTLNHLIFGFVFSHFLIAFFGTGARIVHLSFASVKLLFVLAGLIFMLQFLLPIIRDGIKIKTWQTKLEENLPILALFLVAGLASLLVLQRVVGDDDLTYLAYLTNWQNSTQLNFQDIFFGETGIVHPRFWIMSAPFAQALLTEIAEIPGILLLGGYYEPFLVILATIGWYKLARRLSFSRYAASASAILELVFLLFLSDYFQPGASFYTQLSADKATAAFIFAPVFFQSLIQFLKKTTKNNWVILLFAGLSLTFMHPVILAYSVLIGGVFLLLNWKNTNVFTKIFSITVLVIILLPQASLRFVDASSQVEIPFTSQDIFNESDLENMTTRWRDTQFYGFNPAILEMRLPYAASIPIPVGIQTLGWLIFPILASLLALKQAGKSSVAQFLLACFLLAFLAWLPFTGWIIGYFLSAYMLERALWLFPFGLSVVYSVIMIKNYVNIKKRIASPSQFLMILTAIATSIFALHMFENDLPNTNKFATRMQRYQGLAIAGQELDWRISDQAFVLGSEKLNDLIPGLSSRSKIITFRISQKSNMAYFSDSQREERILDTQKIFLKSLSVTEKMFLIEKYNIRFLFLQSADLRLFEELIDSYQNRVEILEVGGVILVEISD